MAKLTADKMLSDGFAMARTDKGIVFVDGLLPGETGEVERSGKKGGVKFFETKKVLQESPHRRKPDCHFFSRCGGCSWLHIAYEGQLEYKVDIFNDAMTRIGKLENYPQPEVFSGEEFGYRQRVQFKVDRRKGQVGFFKRKSNAVVAVNKCPLLTDALNEQLADPKPILRTPNKKRGMMMFDTGNGLISNPVVEGVSEESGKINVGKYSFALTGSSFFQGNKFLVEEMATWCNEEVQGEKLLDLFGGVGLFSLFHGSKFKSTTLVEMSEKMATKAQEGFVENGFDTGKAIGSSSEDFFKTVTAGDFDTVIVDPPREGLSNEVRGGIEKLKPNTVLYISCNPSTQARDLSYFVKSCGYEIKKTALFDLYPNTPHVESGVLLVRGEEK